MNELVKEFLVDRFVDEIHELADDPRYIAHYPDDPEEWDAKKWISMYVLTAEFLGLDFWKLLGEAFGDAHPNHEVIVDILQHHDMIWGWHPNQDAQVEPNTKSKRRRVTVVDALMKVEKTLTLDQFVATSKMEIDEFKHHWGRQRSLDPKNWPLSMSEEDWTEQLLAFLATNHKKEI